FKGVIDFASHDDLNDDNIYDSKYYSKNAAILDTFNKKYAETTGISYQKFVRDRNKKLLIKLSSEKLTWSSSNIQSQQCLIILKEHIFDRNAPAKFEINIEADYKYYYETKNVIGMVPGTEHKD